MNGYQNERNFIKNLNNKKYCEINILLQDLLHSLFPKIQNQDIIKSYKYSRYAKADIIIEVNGIQKGISIKSGICNSVHIEPINNFIQYLKKLKFQETKELLKYLYSDGTINNSGNYRLTTKEYVQENTSSIASINSALTPLKQNLITRFLIKTDVNYKINVDAFIEGTVNDFIWATTDEVINYLASVNKDSSSVHISNLYIQNWNKNIKRNPKYEHCRNYIQIKWYSIFDDLIQIMCIRNNSQ